MKRTNLLRKYSEEGIEAYINSYRFHNPFQAAECFIRNELMAAGISMGIDIFIHLENIKILLKYCKNKNEMFKTDADILKDIYISAYTIAYYKRDGARYRTNINFVTDGVIDLL